MSAGGLTPEIAQQLLEADLANIVELVRAGQPLNQRQRAMLEAEAKKQAAAATQAQATPTPAPATSSASSSPIDTPAPAPAFELEAEGPPATLEQFPEQGEYQCTQSVYAERYGVSTRTIKLWIAEGRAAKPEAKLCPLDHPEAMPAWWHEVKHNRPPAGLLAAADTAKRERVGAGAPAAKENASAGAPIAPAAAIAPANSQAKPLAVGFAASLDRVRLAEAEANERYLAEFRKTEAQRDESRVSRLRREWSELSEQLRFLEKAAPDVLAKSGEMLTKTEVRRILSELHSPIIAGVRSMWRRVRLKLGSLTASNATAAPGTPADLTPEQIVAALERLENAGGTLEQAVALFERRNALLEEIEKVHAAEVERTLGGLCASEFTAPPQ